MKIPSLFLLAAILVTSPAPNLQAEELRNGDFSDASRFWFVLVNGGFRDDDTLAPYIDTSGTDGLHINVGEIPGEKGKPAAVTLNQRVRSLSDGEEYFLRFEVKGVAGESFLVGIGNPADSGPNRGNLAGGIPVKEVAMEGDWQEIEVSFVYNANGELNLPDDAAETVLQFRVGTLSELALRSVSLSQN